MNLAMVRGAKQIICSHDTAVGQVPGVLCAYYGMRRSVLAADQ